MTRRGFVIVHMWHNQLLLFTGVQKRIPVCLITEKSKVVNPYPYLGCPHSECWPRGFPLDDILESGFLITNCTIDHDIKFGVLQSLADHEPDVDAIFRMIKGTPLTFERRMVSKTSSLKM